MGDWLNLYRIKKLYSLIRKGIDNPELFKDSKYWLELFKTALTIREVKEMLKGYKAYIVAALTAALAVFHSLGYIDEQTYQALLALLAAGGLSAVAAKINRIQDRLK